MYDCTRGCNTWSISGDVDESSDCAPAPTTGRLELVEAPCSPGGLGLAAAAAAATPSSPGGLAAAAATPSSPGGSGAAGRHLFSSSAGGLELVAAAASMFWSGEGAKVQGPKNWGCTSMGSSAQLALFFTVEEAMVAFPLISRGVYVR